MSQNIFDQLRAQHKLCEALRLSLKAIEEANIEVPQEHIDFYHQSLSKMLELYNVAYPDF